MAIQARETPYATMFAETLQTCVRDLMSGLWRRDRNPGAPFHFGENHLRKQIREFTPPPTWPRLRIERHVAGDLEEKDKKHGGVDLFFTDSCAPEDIQLQNVLATCEVGGPTRPILLRGSRENWYPKILADIRKQLWRAQAAPGGEHFVGLMVKYSNAATVREDFYRAADSMLKETTGAVIVESSWSELPEAPKLKIAILQILPAVTS